MINAPLIRAVQLADHAQWDRLYQGYGAFYKVTQTAQMRDRVWSWLFDPLHMTQGLVAVDAQRGADRAGPLSPLCPPSKCDNGRVLG